MSNKYCNLHCHDHMSLLDGYGSPEKLIKRAKELGQTAIGITNHGNMSSILEAKKAADAYDIKLVPGNELYIAPWGKDTYWRRDDKKRVGTAFHITCLAYNQQGYANLLKLTELSNKVGFYYVPRIDYGMLERYNEGLIVTSGCMAGAIPRALNPETGVKGSDYRQVNEILGFMYDVFGLDRYYLELQDHDIPELRDINVELFRINKHYGFHYLATNDSHYATPKDAEGQADALCVNAKCSRINPSDFVQGFIDKPDYFLTTYQQMTDKNYGFDVPDSAFTNTMKVADMVEKIYIGNEPEVKLMHLWRDELEMSGFPQPKHFNAVKITEQDYDDFIKHTITPITMPDNILDIQYEVPENTGKLSYWMGFARTHEMIRAQDAVRKAPTIEEWADSILKKVFDTPG